MAMKKDPRVDAYIAKAGAFARPILKTVRAALHEGAPGIVETMRWSTPSFDIEGVPFAQMAAFKAHCRFLIWNSGALGLGRTGADLFGDMKSAADLPPKPKLVAFVKRAAKIRLQHAADKKAGKVAPAKRAKKAAPPMPKDLAAALAKDAKAKAAFAAFSPSHKREYIEWIEGAKREETRRTRIEKCVTQCAEKKSLNWKYA